MNFDSREVAVLKFQREFLGLLRRWLEESDLEDMELVEAAVSLMNEYCEEGSIGFGPMDDSKEKWK